MKKITIISLLAFSFLLTGCSLLSQKTVDQPVATSNTNTNQADEKKNEINEGDASDCVKNLSKTFKENGNLPGEVWISFKDDVDGVTATNILKQYGFTDQSKIYILITRHSYIIKPTPTNEKNREAIMNRLKSSGLFIRVSNNGNYVFADDDLLNVTEEQINNFFNANSDLSSILSVRTKPIILSVKVPIGDEAEWMCRFKENSSIKYPSGMENNPADQGWPVN